MKKKLAYAVKDLVAGGVGGHTTIYDAINSGKLKAKKRGRRTVILAADLTEYLENLPDFHEQAA